MSEREVSAPRASATLGVRLALSLAVAATVAVGTLAMALAQQSARQRAAIIKLGKRLQLPYEGMVMPTAPLASTRGDTVPVGEAEHGAQVLVAVGPTCVFSKASIPALAALHQRIGETAAAAGAPIRLVIAAVDTADSLQQFRKTLGDSVHVTTMSPRTQYLYRIRALPTVLLLDSLGTVRMTHFGALTLRFVQDTLLPAAALVAGPRRPPTTPSTVAEVL